MDVGWIVTRRAKTGRRDRLGFTEDRVVATRRCRNESQRGDGWLCEEDDQEGTFDLSAKAGGESTHHRGRNTQRWARRGEIPRFLPTGLPFWRYFASPWHAISRQDVNAFGERTLLRRSERGERWISRSILLYGKSANLQTVQSIPFGLQPKARYEDEQLVPSCCTALFSTISSGKFCRGAPFTK